MSSQFRTGLYELTPTGATGDYTGPSVSVNGERVSGFEEARLGSFPPPLNSLVTVSLEAESFYRRYGRPEAAPGGHFFNDESVPVGIILSVDRNYVIGRVFVQFSVAAAYRHVHPPELVSPGYNRQISSWLNSMERSPAPRELYTIERVERREHIDSHDDWLRGNTSRRYTLRDVVPEIFDKGPTDINWDWDNYGVTEKIDWEKKMKEINLDHYRIKMLNSVQQDKIDVKELVAQCALLLDNFKEDKKIEKISMALFKQAEALQEIGFK